MQRVKGGCPLGVNCKQQAAAGAGQCLDNDGEECCPESFDVSSSTDVHCLLCVCVTRMP